MNFSSSMPVISRARHMVGFFAGYRKLRSMGMPFCVKYCLPHSPTTYSLVSLCSSSIASASFMTLWLYAPAMPLSAVTTRQANVPCRGSSPCGG